jgi:hypothetical protein
VTVTDPVVDVTWSRDEDNDYEVATLTVDGEVATVVAFTREAFLKLGEDVVRGILAE